MLVLACRKLSPKISRLQITCRYRSGDDHHGAYQHNRHTKCSRQNLTALPASQCALKHAHGDLLAMPDVADILE